MKYFLHTTETIPEGVGFTHYDITHLLWLLGFAIFALISCIIYIKSDEVKRSKIRKIFAFLLIADELFKVIMLIIGGNYLPSYLPLHLCSINIILIAIHAFKPSKMLDNFLYFIGIPGGGAGSPIPLLGSPSFRQFYAYSQLYRTHSFDYISDYVSFGRRYYT